MALQRYLRKAPITEAVLDFRVRLPAEIQVQTFSEAAADLSSTYPTNEEAWLIESSFAFSADPATTASSSSRRANGLILRSSDGRHVAQFRLDGFTFSRLAPYTSWDEIAPEAFRLWEIYQRIAKPEALLRVATRYINRIQLPEIPVWSATALLKPSPFRGTPRCRRWSSAVSAVSSVSAFTSFWECCGTADVPLFRG